MDEMKTHPETETNPEKNLSADQIEVLKYFRSDMFASIAERHPKAFLPRKHYSRNESLAFGWLSLFALTCMAGIIFPLAMYVVIEVANINRPTFIWMSVLSQSIGLPGMIAFTFTTTSVLFWHGPLLIRFALGLGLVTPPVLLMSMLFMAMEPGSASDFLFAACTVFFCQFLSSAVVAVAYQFFSPWYLTEATHADAPESPRMGLRSMLELTGLAALGFVIIPSLADSDLGIGMAFFAVWGFISTIATIGIMIGLLADPPNRAKGWGIALAFSFGASAMICGFFAVAEFGWGVLSIEMLYVGFASLYGTLLSAGVFALLVKVLQRNGWRCVNRRTFRMKSSAT